MADRGKSRRGFASMDPERQREIASKGGRAAHAKGTAHEWTAEEARRAGRKGGETVSRNRAHMAAIGREGGEARGAGARARKLAEQQTRERYPDRELTMRVDREGMDSGRRESRRENRPLGENRDQRPQL